MGFFFEDREIDDREKTVTKRVPSVKAKRKSINAGERGCDACGLKARWGTITTPQMKMSGERDGDILILGGAPTLDADFKGDVQRGLHPLLRGLLPSGQRDRIAFQNTVRCKPDPLEPVQYQDQHACSVHLDAEAGTVKYVVGVGPTPLRRYWPGTALIHVHGAHFPVMIGGHPAWYYPILDPMEVEAQGGDWSAIGSVFKADLARFFRDHKKWGKPEIHTLDPATVLYPETYEEALAIVERMLDQPLGIDLETADATGSALKPYQNGARILTGAISDGDTTIAFAVDHPERRTNWGLRLLLEIVKTRRWVAHNSAFEWIWLWFFDPNKDTYFLPFDDSQALARVYFERTKIASLDDVCFAVLGVDLKSITGVNAGAILEYPLSEVLPYNGLDAQASALIWRKLHKLVDKNDYGRKIASIETVAEMELLGLPVDLDESASLKRSWGGMLEETEERAKKIYEVRQFELDRQKPFRLSANDDIGAALAVYGKMPLPSKTSANGKVTYTTDEATLAGLTKDNPHPLVDCVMDYREKSGTISKYIDTVLAVPRRYPDGLLHPAYTVLFTLTGRLSSNDPNIQNFPKRQHREIRRQVIPPKNHILFTADFGQVEARVIAMASKDPVLCKYIIEGYDIHTAWRDKFLQAYPKYYDRMAEMGNVDPSDKKATLKAGRNIIKTDFVFASFFGATSEACATRTGIPLSIVRDISEEFWDTFRGVGTWIKERRLEYKNTALIKTLTNRVRRGIEWGNEPINTPIQGTAADIMLDGMNELRMMSRELKEPAFMPRMTIHDDLGFFLPDSDELLPVYIDEIYKVMTAVRYPWQIVPLMAEGSVGYNWADLEEIAPYTGDYRR